MIGSGLALIALSGFAFTLAVYQGHSVDICNSNHDSCDEFALYSLGSAVTGIGMIAGGVVLVVFGAQSVANERKATRLKLAPWATPSAGGLTLSLRL